MGEMERPDPSQMRVSDADRHKVADVLRDAAAEGRLDMDELEERIEATYAARTYADLVPITVDLPAHRDDTAASRRTTTPVPYDPHAPSPGSSIAVMGGVTRKGVWTVGERHTAFSAMAGVDLDLRQAQFTARETTIYANCVMGAVDVYVNERTRVIVDGVGVMGAFEQGRDKVEPAFDDDSPVVRITGLALMGAVTVTRKGPPGSSTWRKKLTGG